MNYLLDDYYFDLSEEEITNITKEKTKIFGDETLYETGPILLSGRNDAEVESFKTYFGITDEDLQFYRFIGMKSGNNVFRFFNIVPKDSKINKYSYICKEKLEEFFQSLRNKVDLIQKDVSSQIQILLENNKVDTNTKKEEKKEEKKVEKKEEKKEEKKVEKKKEEKKKEKTKRGSKKGSKENLELTIENLEKSRKRAAGFTVVELKSFLKDRNLKAVGKKEDLIDLLIEELKKEDKKENNKKEKNKKDNKKEDKKDNKKEDKKEENKENKKEEIIDPIIIKDDGKRLEMLFLPNITISNDDDEQESQNYDDIKKSITLKKMNSILSKTHTINDIYLYIHDHYDNLPGLDEDKKQIIKFVVRNDELYILICLELNDKIDRNDALKIYEFMFFDSMDGGLSQGLLTNTGYKIKYKESSLKGNLYLQIWSNLFGEDLFQEMKEKGFLKTF